jgi:hypothetical protein
MWARCVQHGRWCAGDDLELAQLTLGQVWPRAEGFYTTMHLMTSRALKAHNVHIRHNDSTTMHCHVYALRLNAVLHVAMFATQLLNL